MWRSESESVYLPVLTNLETMDLLFIDENGDRGVVRRDRSVEYDGDIAGEVQTVVSNVETAIDSPDPSPEKVYEELVIELPRRCHVVETRIREH